MGQTNFRKRHVVVKKGQDETLGVGHVLLREALAALADQRRHLGRVDLVHLGAQQHQRRGYLLVVVFVEDAAEAHQPPQVGDGEVESALGDVELPAQPHDPLGSTTPIAFLEGLDGRS